MSTKPVLSTEFLTQYDDVKHETTEQYFSGNQFAIDAFNKKYALEKGETYIQAIKRICDYIASCEKTPDLRKYWAERWFDELYNDWWHPAGSIMQGAASGRKISLCNCTTVALGSNDNDLEWDNLESIIKNAAYTVAKSAAYRQGLGIDFSKLRPKKAEILNSANESTGVVHWMKFVDSIGYYVGQKGRIPAMLFSLSCTHPDVEEFIAVKGDYTQIQNANISVQCTDAFYKAIENGAEWEMSFNISAIKKGDKIYVDHHSTTMDCKYEKESNRWYYIAQHNSKAQVIKKKVPARELMMKIATAMYSNAEPGIQNIDVARKYSNSDYVYDSKATYDSRILSTNACQPNFATVLTPDGIKTFNDISVGSIIWSGKNWTKVVKKWKTGTKEVFEFHTSAGAFIGTGDHTVFSRGNKVLARDAKYLDIVKGPLEKPIGLDSNDVMSGLLIGDGSYHNIPRLLNNVILYIGNNDHDYFQSEISHLIQHQSGNSTSYYVDSDFSKTDLPKTYLRIIPNKYYHGTSQEKIGFLRGLFSANGNVLLKDKRIALKQASRKLILQVRDMLSSLGIKSYITTNKEKNIKFSNGNYTTKTSYDLNITSDRKIFAQTIGFIQKYKMVVLDQICRDEIKSYKRFLDSYKIQQVVSLGKHEVFDITVDDISHAYWTGGILVSNCSEQYLSRESLCVLASVNAGRFSTDKIQFDDEIKKIAYSINRFLDNTNEMELQDSTYATPHQRLAIKALRRTGAGVTNLGEWLLKNNHEYGTKDGNDTIEEFVKKYNYHLYESSISLGHEKGSFELFDRHKFEQSPFIKRMMKLGLEFSAMRNVTCSSIAPTGTLSLMFRGMVASYGIEPSFGLYFWKRTRMNGKYEYYFCVPSVVRKIFEDRGIKLANQDVIKDTWDGAQGLPIAKIIEDNKSIVGIHCRNATDISALDKLDLMAKVMKHCDSSISVTYMLPETSTPTDVYNFILEAHKKEIKSIAAFPDKKLYGIVSSIPFKQLAINLIESHVEIHKQNFSEEELTQLHFATKKIVPTKIQKTVAPPRPKILECDVHHIKVVKKLDKVRTFDYLVIVGLLNNDPYEVFVMENGVLDKKYIKGTLTHLKKGVYSVSFEDGTILNNITENTTEEEDIFTRMTSTSLRHGADIKFVVEQLEKSQGDMWSFGKAMARSLKRYIPDGTLIKAQCPNCGNQLVRHEGCKSCTACDYTACS